MAPWEYLRQYVTKSERLVVGLMSGTSVDGVDAALVKISGSQRSTTVQLIAFHTHPYPTTLRDAVLRVSHNHGNASDISQLNVGVGKLFAQATDMLLRQAGIERRSVDLIASHGQTISHTPTPGPPEGPLDIRQSATLQIGESSVIAQMLHLPVLSDFRTADIAVGGQGAPLVPYADWCLLTHPVKSRAVQNIGGIANVTYLPANATANQVIGFDTGPGNMLIDQAMLQATDGKLTYDRNGDFARQGTVQIDILERLLYHPFLLKIPPKSAGREQFGATYFESLYREMTHRNLWLLPQDPFSAIATLTAFTAFSIADAYERYLPALPDEVIVGGGGAKNAVLMKMLRERLSPIPVLTHEGIGILSDAKEAIAFAVLANESMLGNPANLPSVTGATRPTVLGKLTFP